jgi:DNA segregation ATPase FtsK/SpoIIIE, S-DNA-T family
MSEKGPVADAIAVSITPEDGTFVIRIQVGEAKFIEQISESTITTEARKQVSATIKNLGDLFHSQPGRTFQDRRHAHALLTCW